MEDLLFSFIMLSVIPGLTLFGMVGLLLLVFLYPIGVIQNLSDASWTQIGYAVLDVLIVWPIIISLSLKNK